MPVTSHLADGHIPRLRLLSTYTVSMNKTSRRPTISGPLLIAAREEPLGPDPLGSSRAHLTTFLRDARKPSGAGHNTHLCSGLAWGLNDNYGQSWRGLAVGLFGARC